MRFHLPSLLLFASCIASAVIIDRIAATVENRIVKESDIKRDIRVTSFLNSENPDFSVASQRKALNRLIDLHARTHGLDAATVNANKLLFSGQFTFLVRRVEATAELGQSGSLN